MSDFTRNEVDQDWDQQRGEVQIELAELIGEYGIEVVLAECSSFVAKQTATREKENYREDTE